MKHSLHFVAGGFGNPPTITRVPARTEAVSPLGLCYETAEESVGIHRSGLFDTSLLHPKAVESLSQVR